MVSSHSLILRGPNSSGWTQFAASVDTAKVYVSSSGGSDVTGDGTIGNPYATIATGIADLRDGYPDWLLLKCGDTFTESISIAVSGRSATEPLVISSYGSGDRPLIRSGVLDGVSSYNQSNISVVGLQFWPHTYDGTNGQYGSPNGMDFSNGSNILVEDCYLDRFSYGLILGSCQSAKIRRNVVSKCYRLGDGVPSIGLYSDLSDGILIEENVWDHCGWDDDIPGSTGTWFRRAGYIQNGCTNVVFRGNIVAGTDGFQIRCGGAADNNLLARNARALALGFGGEPESSGVLATVTDNVIDDGGDYGSSPWSGSSEGARGYGIELGNISHGSVTGNIIANNVNGHQPMGVAFSSVDYNGNTRGCEDTTFSGNIVYNWGIGGGYGDVAFWGSLAQTDVTLSSNTIVESGSIAPLIYHNDATCYGGITSTSNTLNSAYAQSNWANTNGVGYVSFTDWKTAVGDTTSVSTAVSFVDPTRTVAKYAAHVGLTESLEAFMVEARLQRKGYWRTAFTAAAVNAWIRAGFVEA